MTTPTDNTAPDAADTLDQIAPAFVGMAHRIVWCTVATCDADGRPRTRVLHPIWQYANGRLTGWIATSPESLKARQLDRMPYVSLTYWDQTHDTCSAECSTSWDDSDHARRAGWDRFAKAPPPVGYDPSIIPGWDSPASATFGILRLEPERLRVMPGSMITKGKGSLLTWRRS